MAPLRRSVSITPKDMGGDNAPDLIERDAFSYDYLSFVNDGTHGIPPLVTRTRDKQTGETVPPVARDEDRIMYVNTSAFAILDLGPVEREE